MCQQYKSFENIVGKGEIARNEHFLPFPTAFLPVRRSCCHFHQIWNCCLQTISVEEKFAIWERAKFVVCHRFKWDMSKDLYEPFLKQALVFTCLLYRSFENTVGKREIARNEQFLLFLQCSLPF